MMFTCQEQSSSLPFTCNFHYSYYSRIVVIFLLPLFTYLEARFSHWIKNKIRLLWRLISQLWLFYTELWDINSQLRKKKELRVYISQFCLYFSELWVYITQFWKKSQNCKFVSRNYEKKSQNCEIKSQLPFLYFIQWWKRASIRTPLHSTNDGLRKSRCVTGRCFNLFTSNAKHFCMVVFNAFSAP